MPASRPDWAEAAVYWVGTVLVATVAAALLPGMPWWVGVIAGTVIAGIRLGVELLRGR